MLKIENELEDLNRPKRSSIKLKEYFDFTESFKEDGPLLGIHN